MVRHHLISMILAVLIVGSISVPVAQAARHVDTDRCADQVLTSPILINGDLELQLFPGLGTEKNPFRIENYYIVANHTSIRIINTTFHVIIRACQLEAGSFPAVSIKNAENVVISECRIRNSSSGIFINKSSDVEVIKNNISLCDNAVVATASTNVVVTTNRIYHSAVGVTFQSSENSTVSDNEIFGNSQVGVTLDSNTRRVQVIRNKIGWNGPGRISSNVWNAADSGELNEWDDNVSVGNMWSDYSGTGEYSIRGLSQSKDKFPSTLVDAQAPSIGGPGNFEITIGTEAPEIEWNVADTYPFMYTVSIDSVNLPSSYWDVGKVAVSLTADTPGTKTVTIRLEDCAGNTVTNTVNVYIARKDLVKDPSAMMMSSIISVIGVALLIIAMKKTL